MTNKVSGYRTDQIDYKYVLQIVIHGKTARRPKGEDLTN